MEKGDTRLEGLDALRGMAALSILLFHCIRLRMLIPNDETPMFIKLLYVGVPLFFCISAFSLCAGYYGRLWTVGQIATFYKRRYLRIAPLFYVMAAVWVLIMSWLYQTWRIPALSDILLNLTFLFNFAPAKAASLVPAGWSMGVEALFYVAFPLLVFLIRGLWQAVCALAVSIGVAIVAGAALAPLAQSYSWYSVATQAPFFVAGILLFHAFERLKATPWRSEAAIALIGFTLVAVCGVALFGVDLVNLWGFKAGPHLIGLCLMPLVLAFALKPVSFLVNRATVFMGKISYGVYLIHPAVITMVARPIQDARKDVISQWPMLFVVIGVTFIVTVIFASMSYYWLERPIMNWRRAQRGQAQMAAMAAE
jgi:peptidoglycan/LPS O-acetylase OafA/YrhL